MDIGLGEISCLLDSLPAKIFYAIIHVTDHLAMSQKT